MNRMTSCLALLALLAAAPATPAFGDMAPPPSTPLKVAVADVVLVGQVTAIADKAEKAELYKGDTRDLKVATVKVASALLGKPGSTTVKVGFIAYPEGRRRFPTPQLTSGQEVMLVLTKHPTKKGVFVLTNYYDVVAKANNTNFKKEVADAKRAAELMARPQTGLKAKSADDRLLAAALLIHRYKTPAAGNAKTEAVPAAESKLILTALADADWANAPGRDWQMSPQGLFFRLGATEKDGWVQPKDFQQIAPAAKKWLKDNAATFKMTRFARDKATDDPEP